ncbi:MAG TPA: GDP-mannose 4,6-dehydratase [Candidatus Hydrogenedentes bacterium]|nr:GDP-mannose 4,6-dehydratase [Candidatus Hydrogenedentota bacterium]
MQRVALITGAQGFVGRVLSSYLRQNGWLVRESVMPGQQEGPNCFACDITDLAQVRKLVGRTDGLSHVFHLAAVTFVPASSIDPAATFEVNVQGTINLVESTRALHPRARFVFVGSAAVYGSPRVSPVNEEHRLAPREPYAISKCAADQYCDYVARAHKTEVLRMRPFNHSGAGQSDQFVLSNFARQIARIERGEIPPVLEVGNIDAARDFLHVDDVVRAYEVAALRGRSGEAYNVASGQAVTIRQALETLLARSSAKIEVRQDENRMRAVDVSRIEGSYTKLELDTGWRPSIPFETILEDLLAYWRQHP